MTLVIAVGGIRPRRRRPGADDVVRTSLRCGSCATPIGEGEVYALVTDEHLRRCMDCAEGIVRAGWDARGVCPWPPLQMTALGKDATADVIVVDFRARLRAALSRSTASPHRAA
jgi:hypothetical protein